MINPDQCDIGDDITISVFGEDFLLTFWHKDRCHININIKECFPRYEVFMKRWCEEQLEKHREATKNIFECSEEKKENEENK